MKAKIMVGVIAALALNGCERSQNAIDLGEQVATEFTRQVQQDSISQLDMSDTTDFELAAKGLMVSAPNDSVRNETGFEAWNPGNYLYQSSAAPETVNPSLWRQAQVNNIRGLFKVTEGVYQLRGFDLANMTLIDSDNGWILVDPLTTEESTKVAIDFAREQLGDKKIVSIIYTHPHVDHFGGVQALMTPEQAKKDGVIVVAPEHFVKEATSENILAGPAMNRRAYMVYGRGLDNDAKGHVDAGLGKQVVFGTVGIIKPTVSIKGLEKQPMNIDGVDFVFKNTPGSEAPSEFIFYLPKHKILDGAEVVNHTMHNLYTLRGAQVRDAVKWSEYIFDMSRDMGDVEIIMGSHHWPIWGKGEIKDFLEKQADLYRFTHDQTMRLANSGLTPREIAEQLELPDSLGSEFYNRGYYGTLSHNIKAVYQKYYGWFNGNPANLNPMTPVDSATRYVEFMGGSDSALQKAQVSFDKGEYRWVAEVVNHVVFAEPENEAARALLAKAYTQLGYQTESSTWRDLYLSGAKELTSSDKVQGHPMSMVVNLLSQTNPIEFLRSFAASINGEKAAGKLLRINIVFNDLNKKYQLDLRNSVLRHKEVDTISDANATLTIPYSMFIDMIVGKVGITDLLSDDGVRVDGSKLDLLSFLSTLELSDPNFNIVTP